MVERIRTLVADDHPLFREGVVRSLDREEDFEVVAEASTGEEAIEMSADLVPDLVMLDLAMPGIGGIKAAERIAVTSPATGILILTVSEDADDLLEALKAGARGYVLKGVSADGLLHAARVVSHGEVYLTPTMANRILHEMTHKEAKDPFDQLSSREGEILELVGAGLTNREIGERLFLAEKTVKHYMTNILQKLHVRSRVEAALLAQRRELEGG
jgi:DNA-binding NarL/FixJ family response regulator